MRYYSSDPPILELNYDKFSVAHASTDIMAALAKNVEYIDEMLKEFKLTCNDIKLKIRTALDRL